MKKRTCVWISLAIIAVFISSPILYYFFTDIPLGKIKITVDFADFQDINVRPVWNTLNVWDVSFLSGNFPNYNASTYRNKQFFVDHINIMTATGGRSMGSNEYYHEDEFGNSLYNFTALLKVVDWVISADLQATIVIGNTPTQLCSDDPIDFGPFDVNIGAPDNYTQYYDYIANLTEAVSLHASSEISKFHWRIMTEPDYAGWLREQLGDYFPIYFISVRAIRSILPDAIIEMGNFAYPEKVGKLTGFLQKLHFSARDTLPDIVSFSGYGGGQFGYDPREIGELAKLWRKALDDLGLNNIQISIEEGQILTDFNGIRLWDGDGTEFGAAWNAGVFHQCIINNIQRYAQWNFYATEVRSPSLNVIEMYEKMENLTLLSTMVTYPSFTRSELQTLGGFGCMDLMQTKGYVLTYFSVPDHYATQQYPVQLELLNIPESWNMTNPTLYLVDRSHSNFFWHQFTEFGSYPRGYFAGTTSIWDLNIAITLNGTGHEDAYYAWSWDHRNDFGLETIQSPDLSQITQNSWSLSLDLPANSVWLWEFKI